jgi:hypothetical protein
MTPYKRAPRVSELMNEHLQVWVREQEEAGEVVSVDTLSDADCETACPHACGQIWSLGHPDVQAREHLSRTEGNATEFWYGCPVDLKPMVIVSRISDNSAWVAPGKSVSGWIIRNPHELVFKKGPIPFLEASDQCLERVAE